MRKYAVGRRDRLPEDLECLQASLTSDCLFRRGFVPLFWTYENKIEQWPPIKVKKAWHPPAPGWPASRDSALRHFRPLFWTLTIDKLLVHHITFSPPPLSSISTRAVSSTLLTSSLSTTLFYPTKATSPSGLYSPRIAWPRPPLQCRPQFVVGLPRPTWSPWSAHWAARHKQTRPQTCLSSLGTSIKRCLILQLIFKRTFLEWLIFLQRCDQGVQDVGVGGNWPAGPKVKTFHSS